MHVLPARHCPPTAFDMGKQHSRPAAPSIAVGLRFLHGRGPIHCDLARGRPPFAFPLRGSTLQTPSDRHHPSRRPFRGALQGKHCPHPGPDPTPSHCLFYSLPTWRASCRPAVRSQCVISCFQSFLPKLLCMTLRRATVRSGYAIAHEHPKLSSSSRHRAPGRPVVRTEPRERCKVPSRSRGGAFTADANISTTRLDTVSARAKNGCGGGATG